MNNRFAALAVRRPMWMALALFAGCVNTALAAPTRAADTVPATGASSPFPAPAGDFAAGTWSLSLYGGYNREFSSDPQMGYGAVGVGYYAFDNFSINAEARTLYADQDVGRDTTVFALDLLIRHHLIRGDGWSVFADASAAVSQSLYHLPADGTHFNFMEEAGFGATVKLDDHTHLIGGVRYWHLSNARLRGADENPGLNGVGGYVGLLFTF